KYKDGTVNTASVPKNPVKTSSSSSSIVKTSSSESSSSSTTKEKVSFKLKNDTGSDYKVQTSAGGTYTITSSGTNLSVKVGDSVWIYDSGKKGKTLFKVTEDIDSKTLNLSKYL